jgi:hypothetical protein
MVRHGRPVGAAEGRGGPLGAAARWVLAVIAVGALIGLAACGSAVPGGAAAHPASASAGRSTGPAAAASASAGVPLCASAHSVDRVVASLSASKFREILPRGITISDAPRVRALAAALCTLPPMPNGLHCTAAGGGFRLVFAAEGRAFHPVGVQLSGCRRVTGIGPARSWSQSPQFGRLLSQTVGGKGRMIPGYHPSSVPTS